MYAMHFFFGIGSLLSPIVAKPFIRYTIQSINHLCKYSIKWTINQSIKKERISLPFLLDSLSSFSLFLPAFFTKQTNMSIIQYRKIKLFNFSSDIETFIHDKYHMFSQAMKLYMLLIFLYLNVKYWQSST